MPPEILFYHLERQPLEKVLPSLVERTLERGWRAVIEVGDETRLQTLNTLLWTYKPEGFLPHGTLEDGPPEHQPVILTKTKDNPNGATVRFLVEGAALGSIEGYERVVLLFDGRNPDALAAARTQWKSLKGTGATPAYWQQDETGRWQKKG
jgi:DNA polymerase III subunit chi